MLMGAVAVGTVTAGTGDGAVVGAAAATDFVAPSLWVDIHQYPPAPPARITAAATAMIQVRLPLDF